MRACASFGLITRKVQPSPPKTKILNAEEISQIRSSSLVLITGASGAGKSCTLRGIIQALNEQTSARVHVVNDAARPNHQHRAMIDHLDGPIRERVATLSSAGLAEPRLWAMPESCLSVGELARMRLAIAMHSAHRGDIVIADEFATPLDRANAYSLARTTSRWASREGIIFIAATAHEDMEGMLRPDLVLDMDTHAKRAGRIVPDQTIEIVPGSIADFDTLSHLHYLGSKPATHTLVLKAVRELPTTGRSLAGVLMISMPTLNGSWRERAWPGFFSTADKTLNTKRINRHLRCISRVIVEPRSRGLGIASMLVRAYLDNPQTQATEAIAAMGSVCPFFERSGMQQYTLLHAPVDLRLIDALEHNQRSLTDLVRIPIEPGSFIERELITWSKVRKYIGPGTPNHQTIEQLALIAACRLLANPRAYAQTHQSGEHRNGITG